MTRAKAVILARGLGTRMRRQDPNAVADTTQHVAADSGVKALIPVGRPFLDHVISALADAGITDVCIVVAPGANPLRDHYDRMAPSRIRITFAVQDEPRGTADAVLAAESFADGDHVVVLNSDNYYPVDSLAALRSLATQRQAGVAAFDRDALIRLGNIEPARIAAYSRIEIDADGMLLRIVEKPADENEWNGRTQYVGMNSWSLPPEIHEAARRITPSERGELELPAAVQYARDRMGVPFKVLTCSGGVLDLSTRADIASVAARLRDREVRL